MMHVTHVAFNAVYAALESQYETSHTITICIFTVPSFHCSVDKHILKKIEEEIE